jgi:hypothetical protein
MLSKLLKKSLLKFFKIEKTTPAGKEEFLESLGELLEITILDYILGKLDNESRTVFLERLKDDTTGEKALELAVEKIPRLQEELGQLVKLEIERLNSQ